MGAERGLARMPDCPTEGAPGPTSNKSNNKREACFAGELTPALVHV